MDYGVFAAGACAELGEDLLDVGVVEEGGQVVHEAAVGLVVELSAGDHVE
jgi:hypothetical protein